MSQYSNLIITNLGMQLYKKTLKANSTLIISSILAVQNGKFKTMSIEQLQSLNIENGDFGTLGKRADMMINTPYFDYNQPVETAMELSASIDNTTGIENGMTVDGIVLVTNDPFSGDIIPFAISKAIDPEIIPPKKDNDITYTFTADLLLNVDRTDKISVKYSPDGLVKRKDLEKHEEEADDTYARKIDTYTKIETNREIQNAQFKEVVFWDRWTRSDGFESSQPGGEFGPRGTFELLDAGNKKEKVLKIYGNELVKSLSGVGAYPSKKEGFLVNHKQLDEDLDKKADKTDLNKKMNLKVTDIDTSNASKYNLNTDLFSQKALEGRYRFVTTAASQSLGIPEEVRFIPFYLQITNFDRFQEQVIVASNSLIPTIYRRIIGTNLANKRTWYKFTGIPVEK